MSDICPYYGKCGGCTKPIITFEEKKEKILTYIKNSNIEVENNPILSYDGPQLNYRNRMDFVFSQEGPGLREKGKFYKVIPIKECKIAHKKINEALSLVWEWFEEYKDELDVFDIEKTTGTLRYATIRASAFTKDLSVTFILNENSPNINIAKEKIKVFAEKYQNKINNVIVGYVYHKTDQSTSKNIEVIKGKEFLFEKLNNITYKFHSQGFFQTNSLMTVLMLEHVKKLLDNDSNPVFIDLFGGIGTFGIYMAENYEDVYILDNNEFNIKMAIDNTIINDTINVFPYVLDAKEIKKFFEEKIGNKKFTLLVDPPRPGLHKKTVKFLYKYRPDKLIYVSCNPKNLEKELVNLKKIYKITNIAFFDNFPRTTHIEVILKLELK